MFDLKTTPTMQLVQILCETQDQGTINLVAYELACRIYVPYNNAETFEELLTKFGYRKEESQVKKLVK